MPDDQPKTAVELDARRQFILGRLESHHCDHVESQILIAELAEIDSTLFPNGIEHRDPDIVAYEERERRELDALSEAMYYLSTHPHIDPIIRLDIIRRLDSLDRRKR